MRVPGRRASARSAVKVAVAVAVVMAVGASACAREWASAGKGGPSEGASAGTAASGSAGASASTAASRSAGVSGSAGVGAGAGFRPGVGSLVPLKSDPAIVPLAVDGYPDAVVSIPLGATSPRPVVVATHGLWDPPEGLCDDQRWIFRDRAWVVCPRGKPMPDKTFRYESAGALAREIDADLRALEARYPGYVDDHAMLYTGFSLGAILGVTVIARDPARFPRAVLIEGGEDRWTPALAKQYARGGGQRVLFACGLRGRVPAAERAATTLVRAGVDARAVLGKLPDTGQFIHWYNGPIADETRAQQGWLFEGDPRWSADGS